MQVRGPSSTLGIVVTLLISVGLIGYGGFSYVNQSEALSSSVQVKGSIDSVGVEEVSGGRRGGVEYRPTASYTYSLNGSEYTGESVYPGNLGKEFETREAAQLDYEEGESVTVYVEKGSPGNSFLKHESSNGPFFLIGFGVLMIAVTAYTGFYQ
jgi:hypothetical protein